MSALFSTDKTLLVEAKVTLSDVNNRNLLKKLSNSTPVESLYELDLNFDVNHPYSIEKIKYFLCIIGYSDTPLYVDILNSSGDVTETLKINNLFLSNLESENKLVIRTESVVPVRLNLIYN